MRIEVVGRDVEATEAITTYAEKKAGKLERFADLVQQITYTIARENANKDLFTLEGLVDVEHHKAFVAKIEHEDIYAGLDLVTDKLLRQLTDFKEKLKLGNR